MVKSIREIELALGSTVKAPSPSELKNRSVARKSLVASAQIRKGEVFTQENLTAKRPGSGVSPMHYWELLGRVSSRDYREDELIEP